MNDLHDFVQDSVQDSVRPHDLGCLFSGNCDFCQDSNCGVTKEWVHSTSFDSPQFGTGWKCCAKPECIQKVLLTQNNYCPISQAELHEKFPTYKIYRSNGTLAADWKIFGLPFRWDADGPLLITVGFREPQGVKCYWKNVPYDTFCSWQQDSEI